MKPSLFVDKQLPEFVRANYPLFMAFLKSYYNNLEKEETTVTVNIYSGYIERTDSANWDVKSSTIRINNSNFNNKTFTIKSITTASGSDKAKIYTKETLSPETNVSITIQGGQLFYSNELSNFDIDKSIDMFINRTIESIYSIFDVNGLLYDRKFTLKHLNYLMSIKGTEESYRILFRLLYNDEAVIYYPWESVFKASDGTWIQPRVVKTTLVSSAVNIPDLIGGKLIVNNDPTKYVTIKSIVRYYENNIEVYEIEIDKETQAVETIHPGDTLSASADDVFQAISSLDSEHVYIPTADAGAGYEVGQTFSDNHGGAIVITEVNSSGGVTKAIVSNYGNSYAWNSNTGFNYTTLQLYGYGNGQARVHIGVNGLVNRYGFYANNKGQTSDDYSRIHDNYYYQKYSYVIKSSAAIKQWGNIVKTILHNAGSKVFGTIILDSKVDVSRLDTEKNNSGHKKLRTIIEHIIIAVSNKTKLSSATKMRFNKVDYARLGMTYHELDQYKFNFPDCLNWQTCIVQDSNYAAAHGGYAWTYQYIGTTNENYWLNKTNTPIGHFSKFIIGDFITKPYKNTVIQKDPYIKIYKIAP